MEYLSFNYCSCPTLTGIDSTYGDCGACGPSGKRISKTVNGQTIYTICFDPTMDFDESGGPTNPIARYIQNPNVLDEPISIRTSTGTYYYLFDGLGSVTGLTDSNGNLVSSYKYDAFGNIISETGDSTLNAINPYRFTSRVYDKESGLYYYRARYYDARNGRFTQKDPLRSELKEGNNLYVYVGNNPVNRNDPMGLWDTETLKYKVCFWGWCKWVTYGWKLKLSNAETITLLDYMAKIGMFLTAATLIGYFAGVLPGVALSFILGGYAFTYAYILVVNILGGNRGIYFGVTIWGSNWIWHN